MSPLISLRDMKVRRNQRDVLHVAKLDIEQGETLAVVGPNGAGKSTLLLTLAHLIKPASGKFHYKGKDIQEFGKLEYRRKIAFVFQDPLLMDMPVEENVGLGLKFRGTPRAELRSQSEKWMRAMGVEHLAKRRAGQLSGGEAQRVSLARAFVLDPELLLMDEPFSAVDPQTRGKLMFDLACLLAQDKRTTIFVTHNLKEARQMGNRIAVVIDGELRQVGNPEQVKENPADHKVGEFLKEL